MTVDVSEKNIEATIEALLLAGGPDAYPGGIGAVEGQVFDLVFSS